MPYIGQPPIVGDTTSSFRLLDNIASYTLTFDATSSDVVSTTNDTLTFSNHRFVTAQRVTYTNGGGTAIGGLTSGTAYFIIKVDQNTIKLATSAANANVGTAIDLTSGATGTTHTLNVAFDGVNTKFKATYNNGTKAKISRAGQLLLSINGVIQQPQETSAPTVGFGIDADSTIVFSVAPVNTDVVFGNIIANTVASFDLSDNTVDNFTGDGSTVSFNLSKTPANSQNVLVTLNGVVQYPTDTSTSRAYSVTGNLLTFVSPPGSGVEIQVRHIGFAGATTSAVTGFYGRTGNVVLTGSDDVTVRNLVGVAATFTGNVSIAGTLTYEDVTNIDSVGLITARSGAIINTGTATTALVVNGDTRITGILTVGSSSVTIDGSSNSIRIGTGVTITSSGIVATAGVTTVSAGSTSAPSITPVGDTNTGIFFPSADTIAFAEGGAEAARFDSSGRFGLGTSSPGAKCDIRGGDLHVAGSSSNNGNIYIFNNNASSNGFRIGQGWSTGTDNIGFILNIANADIVLGTNNTERARIDSSGRLLVGTSTSSGFSASRMIVTGAGTDATASGNLVLQIGQANGSVTSGEQIGTITFGDTSGYSYATIEAAADLTAGSDSPGRLVFSTTADGASSPTERMRIDSSGRLLTGGATAVGTHAGSSTLQLRASDSGAWGLQLRMRNSGNDYHYISFTDTNSSESVANIYCQRTGVRTGYIGFETNDGSASATERVRIQGNGATKLTTTGSFYGANSNYHESRNGYVNNVVHLFNHSASSGSIYGIQITYDQQSKGGSTSDEYIYCNDSGAVRMSVRGNGGIANYSGNNVNLCDEREKKNIVNLDSTWDCLKHWELKKFHYNEDADADDLRYGVIAQQVADYCPEVISEWVKQKAEPAKLDEEGNEIEPAKEEVVRMAVKEQQMMWMAINALQEAQLRIETLEAEVAALKGV